MKHWPYPIGPLLAASIAVLVFVAFTGVVIWSLFDPRFHRNEFQEVCAELGGKVVHDGRQFQCLKP